MSDTRLGRAIETLRNELGDDFKLTSDCLLVEPMPVEEIKTRSGIIIHEQKEIKQVNGMESHRPNLVRVLAVGEGYVDSDGENVPLSTVPGDIIMVGRLSVQWMSCFGPLMCDANNQLGMTREQDIQMYFAGDDSYKKACDMLETVAYGN